MTRWQNFRDDPLTGEELQKVRLTVERVDDADPIIRPVVAVVKNWKAWLVGLAFFVWINRPEIISALSVLLGGK